MRRIIIFTDYFYPSKKAGGPITSLSNLIDLISEEFEIKVICLGYDVNEQDSYAGVQLNEELVHPNYTVYYSDRSYLNLAKYYLKLKMNDDDVVYINTFFSLRFHFLPLLMVLLKVWKPSKVILAVRGQLMNAALKFKELRKRAYLILTKHLFRSIRIYYQSTSQTEDIQLLHLGFEHRIHLSNIPTLNQYHQMKINPELKMVFYSRIHPKKNLKFALKILTLVDQALTFDIYGNIEDQAYWQECETLIKQMNPKIKIKYQGNLEQSKVFQTLSKYDCLFVPSVSENYGHAFVEAMQSSCMLLISDQTPWTDFDEETVFAYPLDLSEAFINRIHRLTQLSLDEKEGLRKQVSSKIDNYFDRMDLRNGYVKLFNA